MSIRHIAEVIDDPYFTKKDKTKFLVAIMIADSARSEDGKAWPSVDTLAKKSRTSVRGVQESCRDLQRDGKLEVFEGQGPKGTNVYQIITVPTPAHAAPAPIAPRNEAAVKAAVKAADGCTQSVLIHQEPSGTKEKPSVEGLKFTDFFKQLLPEGIKLSPSIKTSWAECYDKMLRLDNRNKADIKAVCEWGRNDPFWSSNFMSPMKLREKKNGIMYFDSFMEKMKAHKNNGRQPQKAPADSLAAHRPADYHEPTPEEQFAGLREIRERELRIEAGEEER